MNELERLIQEYVTHKAHQAALDKMIVPLRKQISEAVAQDGHTDDKGHKILQVGKWRLVWQKRQGDPYLDKEAAEAWAREEGFWDDVKVVVESVDPDELAGWVFSNRNEPGVEDTYRSLFIKPEPTWALLPPKEEEDYEY
jgi:hypothetical protein